MSATVSAIPTADLPNRCYECGLYFSFLHVDRRGWYLCRLCLELSGQNRSSGRGYTRPGRRVTAVNGRPIPGTAAVGARSGASAAVATDP
jgi:hypothetical protein